MESPSRSESSTESAGIRRVELEHGRVVHLPNNMPDERVREVRSSQQDLQFCNAAAATPPPFKMAAALTSRPDVTPRRHDQQHRRQPHGITPDVTPDVTPDNAESALTDARLALTHARTSRRYYLVQP
jgi:hypothetical protein